MTIRVVQWTTGVVGKAAVRGIVRNPALQLVGCYTQTKEKVGKDVGALCAMERIGVFATDNIQALLAPGQLSALAVRSRIRRFLGSPNA
jgi:hypothetical protein